MSNQLVDQLKARDMSRKEFLLFLAIGFGSIFGISGLIRELSSHAATATASLEAENGRAAGAGKLTDATASGSGAVKFMKQVVGTAGTDLTQPQWATTVVMTNLSTSATDNTAAFQAYLSAATATPYTKLVFPNTGPASYAFSQSVSIKTNNVGVFGGTANPADTVMLSTNQYHHGYQVYGLNHFAKGFTHKVQLASNTARSSQNQNGACTLLLDGTLPSLVPAGMVATGFRGEDIVLDSAAAAGFFAYKTSDYILNRVVSQNSLADSFHNTNGCSNGQFIDCTATNGGDDGFAVIQYGGDPTASVSHDISFTRCHSSGSKARAFSAVCVHDITYTDCYAESSVAPGVYWGREFGNTNPQDCYNITSNGTFIIKNCDTGTTSGNNGAFFMLNGDNSGKVRNITVAQCAIINTPPSNNACVRALSYDGVSGDPAGNATSGIITATLNNFSFYGTTPTTSSQPWVAQDVAGPNSAITKTNWSGLAALSNGNYTASVQPASVAPTPA